MNAITLTESKRLIALEIVIKSGLQTFVEVGEALMEIRDSRLYRIEHGTFEAYCKEKWKFTHDFARKLIRGSEVIQNLKSDTVVLVPTTETQARPLTKLPAEQQPAAWARAVELAGGEQPTAKQVQAALVVVQPEPISPAKPATEEKIKVIVNQGNQIWAMAKMTLDTIIKQDVSRVDALNNVIKYCNNRIAKKI